MWLDRLANAAALYPLSLVVVTAVHAFAPARNGPLALTEVFAPYLYVSVVILVPLAAAARSRWLGIGLVAVLVVATGRLGPSLVSLPAAPPSADETVVTVLSWNLEEGQPATDDLLAVLRTSAADVVAVQELTPAHAAAIEADPTVRDRYPSRRLVPVPGVLGIGILSRWPITGWEATTQPVVLRATLDLGAAGDLVIMNAHPFPPGYRVGPILPIPLRYGASTRDAEILAIRTGVDSEIAAGGRFILIGDFNVTDREPAYDDLAHGLWDAHREVGQGPGATWRPSAIDFLPFGLLRIDHAFGGPRTRPLAISEDCAPRHSDHCVVLVRIAIR